MSKKCMVPCFVCGEELDAAYEYELQPSDGTAFQTYGHYGSTFWDSFNGEELALIICDSCLRKHPERLARHKRFRKVVVMEPPYQAKESQRMQARTIVGREWLDHEPVPYFEGPEDEDEVEIEPEDVGTLTGFHIEWVRNWPELKESMLKRFEEYDREWDEAHP